MKKPVNLKNPSVFWSTTARLILRNRTLFLILIVLSTVFFASQWKHMRFSNTEANLLPDDHPINVEYNEFLKIFGEEGNLIVMGVKDSTVFSSEKIAAWNALQDTLGTFSEVAFTIGLDNLQILEKNAEEQRFDLKPFISKNTSDAVDFHDLEYQLYNKLPFYEGLIYSPNKKGFRTIIALDKDIVNTSARKDFILNHLIPLIESFESTHQIEVYTSGMPYIRTLNSKNIIDEISLFIGAALLVTSLIFFFFFRSFRATLITMLTVMIGVMWCFGILGLLGYEITILTALIPPLIIVIGVANCIFFINKYQKEIKTHGNQAKSLQRVISKVGNATLLTNMTTASGFATFALTQSTLLVEFGTVASLSIIAVFVLSLLIIPIVYSYMAIPKYKHLKHLNKNWIGKLVKWLVVMVRHHRFAIYTSTVILLCVSIIGIYQMKVSGSIVEDMPKKAAFFDDIRFFESEYDGIMPLEILIDTKRKEGAMAAATLRRIDQLQDFIKEIPEYSKPVSIAETVKYAKQAFYNGNPEYYQLPTSQERNFILPYAKNSIQENNLLESYIDSTGQYARITTFMKDTEMDRMQRIEEELHEEIAKIFPEERYTVTVTGKAVLYQKGTSYLIKNLLISLSLAILLIALFMAWMFRSFRMILISLIPNLLPLIITAGVMGFLGVPIKPSTILVFSIAFGISVDDTIHFLAKYRQELIANNWKIKRSVYGALKETGVSMFYSSIVLFFGFSVFMISSFGGTVALGGLVSATLLFAMLSNLLLLPSLLLSLEKSIANKKTLRKPPMDIISEEEK
ncbi:efflux RND transporter permease subunit [Planktosalinus lacus]|uniref:Transporter n=1 Tax=Planktosalinus lacus TaxID=1526573 RepID=A0A8J2V5A5_9FLAO|nr:efflux RND transporter permease subunit [Planktosalinus lacus]GGD82732.1 transporter [Planktosalinus lacus]